MKRTLKITTERRLTNFLLRRSPQALKTTSGGLRSILMKRTLKIPTGRLEMTEMMLASKQPRVKEHLGVTQK
uniref:Uncharacterized protein n=1 Tax=Ciona intestinalis TaxID=7719 RepID=F6YJD5_CIOIN